MTSVLNELRSGSRIAFGAFVDTSDSVETFIGSILIERGEPGVVIATNLLVGLPDGLIHGCDETQVIELVQRRLINRVESFCRQRGFWQIDVEIFAYDSKKAISQVNLGISVLLEDDFHLQSVRNSTYFPQDCYYTFTKKIPFSFSGDPNNESEISRWLLEDHFGFAVISQAQNVWLEEALCHCYTFEVPYSHPDFRIKGLCVVDFGEEDIESHVNLLLGKSPIAIEDKALRHALAEANVRVLISFRKNARAVTDPHIWSLNYSRILELLGPDRVGQPSGEKLGGVVIELTQEKLQDRIKDGKPFGYYVASGLGTDIFDEFHESSTRRNRQFFTLIASHESEGPVVWGVARLDNIESYTSFAAFTGLPTSLRLWDLAHFEYYVNDFTSSYKEHETTYVLTMGQPVRLNRPYKYNDLFGKGGESQHFTEIEVTTRYVSTIKLNEVKALNDESFEEASKGKSLGTADEAPEIQSVVSKLATYLEVTKWHNPSWFGKCNDDTIERLKKSLVSPHRDQAMPQGDEEGDEESPRSTPSRLQSDQSLLYEERSPAYHLRQADRAWIEVETQKSLSLNAQTAWKLRLTSGNLLQATRRDLPLDKRSMEQLKSVFPTVVELRKIIKREVVPRLAALFRKRPIQTSGALAESE